MVELGRGREMGQFTQEGRSLGQPDFFGGLVRGSQSSSSTVLAGQPRAPFQIGQGTGWEKLQNGTVERAGMVNGAGGSDKASCFQLLNPGGAYRCLIRRRRGLMAPGCQQGESFHC